MRLLFGLALLVAVQGAGAGFGEGLSAYQRGDYATALREWRPLAEHGHADARFNLGEIHANGRGVPKDQSVATMWYQLASDQGHEGAQGRLDELAANSKVPKTLFGVGLGDVYTIGDDRLSLDGMKGAVTAWRKSAFFVGFSAWFKPHKKYKDFEYFEYPIEELIETDFHKTTFRLYVHPFYTGPKDLGGVLDKVRVRRVEWSLMDFSKDNCDRPCRKKHYWKIRHLCDVYQDDLGTIPKIIDDMYGEEGIWKVDGRFYYRCEFAGPGFSLELKFAPSSEEVGIALAYDQPSLQRMEDEVLRMLRKAYARTNRPYD
jgi:hypothetical protein